MFEQLGQRWQPGQSQGLPLGRTARPRQTAHPSPAQLLSLRLPTRQAPASIAPHSLLQGQGSQGIGGGNVAGFLTLLSHLLNNPQNAGGGYATGGLTPEPLGADRDPGAALRLRTPGYQAPGSSPTMRVPGIFDQFRASPPTPRFTIGQTAPDEATPLF